MRRKRPAEHSHGIDLDSRVIEAAASWRVPGLTVHQEDAVAFLLKQTFSGRELVYADPPYLRSTKNNRRYYKHEYTDSEHEKLLRTLLTLNCQVMISGYPSPLYSELLKTWNRCELENQTQNGTRTEILWANFPFSANLHDYGAVGKTFRERERIKRKATRWVKNLEQMSDIERHTIVNAIFESPTVIPIISQKQSTSMKSEP